MVICTVIILALLIIAMAAMSANLADMENRIQTLTEDYADLLERIKACSKDLSVLEDKESNLRADLDAYNSYVGVVVDSCVNLENRLEKLEGTTEEASE